MENMEENKDNKMTEEVEGVKSKVVTITIPIDVSEKLDKIAKEDYINLESMIEDYITNKIGTYDEAGIACDDCGKHIKEKEQYFSLESAYCTYEKIGGTPTEDRMGARSDKTLCMGCKTKQDQQKDYFDMKVRHFNRTPNFPMKIVIEEDKEGKE